MKNNHLIIAAAGSGKTTFLIKKAIENPDKSILITTYTESNEQEIRDKFIKEARVVPNNVTIMTWFAFLLKHWVRPYQCRLNDSIANERIGFYLINSRSGIRYINNNGQPVYWSEEGNFQKYYFTQDFKIYSDKISKFCVEVNKASKQAVINRIASLYDMVFIDEVQDLAGFDLELIKLLFKSRSEIILVGDPRQVTYQTHHTNKHSQYSNGNIREFVTSQQALGNKVSCTVDETILNKSHRCSQEICDYSARLYPQFLAVEACLCEECRQKQLPHQGVFIVPSHLCSEYLKKYNPIQLRWNQTSKINSLYGAMNFGESKGKTVDRAIIYPTKDMVKWIHNPSNPKLLKDEARAKFYVALTRARYSVAIILDIDGDEEFEGATIWSLN